MEHSINALRTSEAVSQQAEFMEPVEIFKKVRVQEDNIKLAIATTYVAGDANDNEPRNFIIIGARCRGSGLKDLNRGVFLL